VARRSAVLLPLVDGAFLLLGTVAAGWLAVLTVQRLLTEGLEDWWLVLVLWALLAYLLLPRVHTLLALVYVPDYFIGRTRTYEGLLGDPVNVALLGSTEELHTAMTRAGWHLADELGFRSGLRIITSTLSRRTYTTAPVSPLFLFGRVQDLTYQQEVEGGPARRHHVRFWRTPPQWHLPGGARVDWLAAGTYDRRVGLSAFTLQVTHKIAKDTDAERDHITATVLAGNPEASVSVIRNFSSGYHSRNGGGDAIRTDGDLPVLDLTRIVDEVHEDATTRRLRWHGLGAQARALLEAVRDTGASNRTKRPITLYTGYGLMLLRALVAVVTVLAAALLADFPGAPTWLPELPGPPVQVALALAGTTAAALAYLALGQLAFAGHPVARLLALVLSVVGIVVALAAGPGPVGTASRLWVTNLVLDVGILITLSSGDVRDFHLRRTAERRARRAS
jgi:LssY C-terminus